MSESALIILVPAICLFCSSLFIAFFYREQISRVLGYVSKYPNATAGGTEYSMVQEDFETASASTSNSDSPSHSPRSVPSSPLSQTLNAHHANLLSKYFDPDTNLLNEDVLDPAAPPTPSWEQELRDNIRHGAGFKAWGDRAVERGAKLALSWFWESKSEKGGNGDIEMARTAGVEAENECS